MNAGVEKDLFERVFEESKKFFSLPLEEKMRVARKQHRGYTPLYAENLDPASSSKGLIYSKHLSLMSHMNSVGMNCTYSAN